VALYARRPAWSPSGGSIAFTGYVPRLGGDGISILNLRTDRIESRVKGNFPTWSPEGKMIAFRARAGVAVLRPRHVGYHVLSHGVYVGAPQWSPDGKELAYLAGGPYYAGHESGASLNVIAPAGGRPHRVARGGVITAFAWSPSSKRLAYAVSTAVWGPPNGQFPGGYQLFTVGRDGRNRKQVTHEQPWVEFHSLAFRGNAVLDFVIYQRWNDFELYSVRPDGSGLRQLTDN
jgi:Tol biopolymer transport system component